MRRLQNGVDQKGLPRLPVTQQDRGVPPHPPPRSRDPLGYPPRRTCRRRTGALDELCWLSRRTATLRAVLAIAPWPAPH
ncbi:hypothetical protein A6R68_23536 [Neotoma lepida]|uniref:Uncharacterized protein n=1 Tax=Neotoma lepida TaxID=56216 RepID=A0A1A6HXN2_NEOLE|nr:hypothetical protein A6R68_23536 [Neotoma lepida]